MIEEQDFYSHEEFEHALQGEQEQLKQLEIENKETGDIDKSITSALIECDEL